MKKTLAFVFLLLLTNSILFAQSDLYDEHPAFPYYMTAEEQLLKHTLQTKVAQNFTVAPQGPVTAIAEFQPMSGVMIRYPLGIPVSLVAQFSNVTQVKVLVANEWQQSRANSNFIQHGVNMSNVEFWIIPNDSYWTRDYGPWFIIDGNDEVAVVDFTYNRSIYRPNDDAAMEYVAAHLDMDMYVMPMVHTGGNYMTDGYGTAASTQLVIDENPTETVTSLRQMAQEYLGISQYYFIDDPMNDYIFHIDCWGKFLDVDKVLIAQVPVTDSRYDEYEAAAAVFANATTPWGNHYQVFRVYAPGKDQAQLLISPSYVTPYTNSLILNDHVYVPQTGEQWDDDAIAVYQQAMPGYTIVPVMQVNETPWENTDALHCRTHELADKGMLYIKHYPLLGEREVTNGSISLTADIKALSGQTLVADSLLVYYRINHSVWQNISLSPVGGSTFEATFSRLQNLDTVEYYLFAKDMSGRRECHPYIGAADPHQFVVNSSDAITRSEAQSSIMLYPNPAVDRFVVRGDDLAQLKVYNAMGQLVAEYQLNKSNNSFNCKDWPAGIYYLSIDLNHGTTISRKLVKMN
ncbi:MAG: agmatine deiminase family protein [Bacteroidales bacterium]|nr:agmatine deiminase family protein [Bacteroidales bacterium]